MRRWPRAVLAGQGLYYIATGLWPLLHLPSFESVTGPKTDDWLVRTVRVLAIVIGLTVLAGLQRRRPRIETRLLAGASAAGFAIVETIHVLSGAIRPIYLADAALSVLFLAAALLVPARRAPAR